MIDFVNESESKKKRKRKNYLEEEVQKLMLETWKIIESVKKAGIEMHILKKQ